MVTHEGGKKNGETDETIVNIGNQIKMNIVGNATRYIYVYYHFKEGITT
ncbi:MAG: hypothetical protein HPY89_00785 [Pelotomaculum sp.]|nr:hypothetical protein [Pelotomaculum sp.]